MYFFTKEVHDSVEPYCSQKHTGSCTRLQGPTGSKSSCSTYAVLVVHGEAGEGLLREDEPVDAAPHAVGAAQALVISAAGALKDV